MQYLDYLPLSSTLAFLTNVSSLTNKENIRIMWDWIEAGVIFHLFDFRSTLQFILTDSSADIQLPFDIDMSLIPEVHNR